MTNVLGAIKPKLKPTKTRHFLSRTWAQAFSCEWTKRNCIRLCCCRQFPKYCSPMPFSGRKNRSSSWFPFCFHGGTRKVSRTSLPNWRVPGEFKLEKKKTNKKQPRIEPAATTVVRSGEPTAPGGWIKHPTWCACVRVGFQNPSFLPI